MRPRLLDLFSCAGGAAKGYHDAGFDVVGIDLDPQPNYPYEHHQADVADVHHNPLTGHWSIDTELPGWVTPLGRFDAVHASPPCQHYARVTRWRGTADDHPDLVDIVRRKLVASGIPYVMENVYEAPLQASLMLCGSMFGLKVRRHRYFEVPWMLAGFLPPCRHVDLLPFMHKGERAYADAMGCTWMTNREAREAIPPAYTEYIGLQLLDALKAAA